MRGTTVNHTTKEWTPDLDKANRITSEIEFKHSSLCWRSKPCPLALVQYTNNNEMFTKRLYTLWQKMNGREERYNGQIARNGSYDNSKTFSVHNTGTSIIVLILGYPHFLKCRQWGKNGSSDPDWVLPLGRCHHLHFSCRGGQCRHFFGKTDIDVREHGGSSTYNDIGIQITVDVHIALRDRFVRHFVDPFAFFADQIRFEQHLVIDTEHSCKINIYLNHKPQGIGISDFPQ